MSELNRLYDDAPSETNPDDEYPLPLQDLAEIAYLDQQSKSGGELRMQEAISDMLLERDVMPRFLNSYLDDAIREY